MSCNQQLGKRTRAKNRPGKLGERCRIRKQHDVCRFCRNLTTRLLTVVVLNTCRTEWSWIPYWVPIIKICAVGIHLTACLGSIRLRHWMTQLPSANHESRTSIRQCHYLSCSTGLFTEESVHELHLVICGTFAEWKEKLWRPDPDQPRVVTTAWSKKGMGAVLSQVDSERKEHPVSYV